MTLRQPQTDDAIRSLLRDGVSPKCVAVALGISRSAVCKRSQAMGLSPRPTFNIPRDLTEQERIDDAVRGSAMLAARCARLLEQRP